MITLEVLAIAVLALLLRQDIPGEVATLLICVFTYAVLIQAVEPCASLRYLIFLLWVHREFPFWLGVFCDWCCRAGFLRYSGSSYQFRHREFQTWLLTRPEAPTPDTGDG